MLRTHVTKQNCSIFKHQNSNLLRTHVVKQSCAVPKHQTPQRYTSCVTVASGPRVAVVGGGVAGLTSAVRLLERLPGAKITVVAEHIATDTTTEGAGGLWKPYALSGTDESLVNRWGAETFFHYMQTFKSTQAPASGVFLCPAYELYFAPVPDPVWTSVVPGFRHLAAADIAAYGASPGVYSYGFAYDTIIAEGRLYMAWLISQLQSQGVEFERRRLTSLEELWTAPYDAILNASGLGARELAPDATVHPIRGHVLRLRAPWVRYHVEAETDDELAPCYIIPNSDTVVVGGTKQVGNADRTPREAERQAILERAYAAVPSLAAAEIVGEWVGLRPGRPQIRVEVDEGDSRVVHNYGHGGSGLTLAWGTAGDAADMLAKSLGL